MRAWHNSHHGMTRVDVVIFAAVLVLLLGVILGILRQSSRARDRQQCVANLKQIALGMNLGMQEKFSNDSISKTTPKQSGSLENAGGPNTYRLFQAISNYIGDPGLLVCPADDRKPATNWATLRNFNISYFGNLDFHLESIMWRRKSSYPPDVAYNYLLVGDRYITNKGFDPQTCMLVSSNNPPQWTRAHSRGSGTPHGCFASWDGAVQTSNNEGLALNAQQLDDMTNHLAVP